VKTLQYISIFIAGCCFAGVGIALLLMAFGAYQARSTANRPQPVADSNVTTGPTATTPEVVNDGKLEVLPTLASTDMPTSTHLPTDTPTPVPTALPLEIAAPTPVESVPATTITSNATANRATEIYQGPATSFNVVGSVAAGQSLTLIGISLDGQWYQLADGGWIAAYVVDSLVSADSAPTAASDAVQAAQVPATTPTTPVLPTSTPVPPYTLTPANSSPPVSQIPELSQAIVAAAATTPSPSDMIIVGEVAWVLAGASILGSEFTSDAMFGQDFTTSGKFVLVVVALQNLGAEMKSYTGIELVDDQGRTYALFSGAFGYIPDSVDCSIIENVNPNISIVCAHIFEVAADATGLKANVGDLEFWGGEEGYIPLGF
jgi:hypothetical protein